jgi:CoA-disulfide reductase
MSKKILVIGGVAGGATTVARLRRLDEKAEIIMFERGGYISFANCGLPYYIGEAIQERENLILVTPEEMHVKYNIDIRIKSEVIKIDKENKKVFVKNHDTKEIYEETYDTLVISTGSSPIKPPIEGIDSPNIFTLWNIPDTDNIKSYIDENKPKNAVVVGGGFIGIEMAENLNSLGIKVSLVEMLDQVMTPLDFEMAQILHTNIDSNGVNLYLGDGVEKFEYNDNVTKVILKSGKIIEADIVVLSIGIRPNGELAKDAGLEVNKRGGIIVDEYLKTSDKNIYAIGDVIEVVHYINGNKTMIPLAGPANKQGRICANNILGENEKYKGTMGTSIAKVFDLTAASTGLNEKALVNAGMKINKDYFVVILHQNSHAGYYPEANPMALKMIFDKKGKIFGAQIVGQDGVDKRIDTLAAAIRLNGTVYDLKELEFAYAPPYSSAKDPVNMLGFTAENLLTEKCKFVYPLNLKDIDEENTIILDVREPDELLIGTIPSSINIPLDQLRNRLSELDKSKTIIVYCAIGLRAYIGCRILMQNGFNNVYDLAGGYNLYTAAYFKVYNNGCGNNPNEKGNNMESNDMKFNENINFNVSEAIKVNCSGMQCPGPIMAVYKTMQTLKDGDIVEVSATDIGFAKDIESWCKNTHNTLLKVDKVGKEIKVYIKKGAESCPVDLVNPAKNGKTMVVFSGDLDKAIASFIIANGAASMGHDVTMFFTFWGLNILRKDTNLNIKKPFMEKIFSSMMPRGSKKLKLSKMNMGGMGTKMIRKVMKDKNVDSLETLIQNAIDNGVKIIACTMSMDIMGITKEELIDGIDFAGVGTYLGSAEESNVNLFI